MSPAESLPSLRFDCPACGVTLSIPPSAAGVRGPCPKCWGEIVSPDPVRGLPARLAAATHVSAAAAAEPRDIAPPAPENRMPPAVAPEPVELAPPSSPAELAAAGGAGLPPQAPPAPVARIPWIGPVLASAVVFSVSGFLAGSWMSRNRTAAALPPVPPSIPPAAAASPPVQDSPPPAPVTPPAAESQSPAPAPAAPAAEEKPGAAEVLKSFLDAPDWVARSEFVLFPGEMRDAMEKHAAAKGDGPIRTGSVHPDQSAGPVQVFTVSTPAMPEGFPVAVVDTPDGPKVNWENFVNFHDDLFREFAEGPAGDSGVFHVKIKPDPVPEGEAERLHARFRLSVPMPDREYLAYMRKDSVAMALLKKNFEGAGEWNKEQVDLILNDMGGIPVILKLAKRTTNDNRSYLEIEDLVAVTWSPPARK